jgi:hypothetical protein
MKYRKMALSALICALQVMLVSGVAPAMTAQEILDKVAKQNLGEDFRLTLSIKTFKSKKQISSHSLWLMGRVGEKQNTFFMDFEEPADSKGLRFLLQAPVDGSEPKAFMFLPSTGKTLPLAVDDPSVDVGGTGLTMEDVQGFAPRAGETAELIREEKLSDRDCYVIRINRPAEKIERTLWISKKDSIVIKSEDVDSQGKIARSMKVVEFFKASNGREFPREEEILIPSKDMRILMRQENAVFGVEVPDELMDPGKFGAFSWKM